MAASAAFRPLLLATVTSIGALLIQPGTGRTLSLRLRNPTAQFALGLLAIATLSVPGSLYPGLSFDYLLKNHLASVILFLILLAGIRGPEDLTRFAAVVVVGGAIYSATVLTRYDLGPDGRLGDLVYYDANDMGMLLDCTLPFALYFAVRARALPWRIASSAAAVLFLAGIVRSGSRGAFLGLVAVGLYTLVRGQHIPLRWRVTSIVTAALLLVVLASDQYWRMMQTLLNPKADYNWAGGASGGRMEVWKRGVGYMLHHPILGVGLGAFPVAEGTLSSVAKRQSYGGGAKWSAAHSSYVQVGGELGVGGAFLFLAILWTAFRGVTRRRRGPPPLGPPIAASLVGYAVAGAFLSQAYATMLYAILALAVGAAQLAPTAIPRAVAPLPARGGVRRVQFQG
jgi:O-antigen ligase